MMRIFPVDDWLMLLVDKIPGKFPAPVYVQQLRLTFCSLDVHIKYTVLRQISCYLTLGCGCFTRLCAVAR